MTRFLVCAVAGLAPWLGGAALAQEPAQPLPEAIEALSEGQALHVAVTASGGASLGSYQAGWLYYLSEIAKRNPERWDLDVVTGTSAGGINGLVMVLSACGALDPDPRESPFYRTWIPVGLVGGLFDPDATRPDGVLDRRGFDVVLEDLRAGFETGLREGCTMDWGVAVARLDPRYVPLGGGYQTPLAQEQVVVRIVGQGEGNRPIVTPRVLPEIGYDQPVLPVSDPEADVFALLRDAAFATSAFPVAFRPMELPVCLVPADGDPSACTLAAADRPRYVDGGLYDNAPIRLAHGLAAANGDAKETIYLYLDAYLGRFPGPPSAEPKAAEITRTVTLLGHVAKGVLLVSGQRSLVTLLEEDAAVVDRLSVATAYSPQLSRELSGFFGLFQAEIREYDFWLGLYSASREIRERSTMFHRVDLTLPQDVPDATPAGWAVFRCLEATYEGTDPAACELAEAQRLVPLVQVGVERLYAWCVATPSGTLSGVGSEHCDAARAGEPPPRVHGANEPGPDWALRPGETSLDHALRRLAWHGFVFTDLGESEASEKGSRRTVRRTLHDMVDRLAAVNGGQAILVRIVGGTGIDQMVPLSGGKP